MQRRQFVTSAAALATLTALSARAYAVPADKPRRVGLIGPGWYGKCDLLQLMNVEPVEVVSLCDVDSKMLSEAADLFQARQASGKRPQTFATIVTCCPSNNMTLCWSILPTTGTRYR